MLHNPQLLPLVPERVLRARYVYERYDTRFRAAARLLQAVWRERRDLPFGHHVDAKGARRRLGSVLAPGAARSGGNFLSPDIFGQARLDLAYREPGALIDAERLWSNLLSSMPLAFNLLAPLKTDRALARRTLNHVLPGALKRVAHIQLEHSPGRGDPIFTADGTAFDALITGRGPEGQRRFVGLEIKYAESLVEPEPRLRPRYDELSRSSGLYAEPDDEALRRNPLQQFWRQHMLAQAMVDCELYDEGVYVLIAPRQNREVQRGAHRYARTLADSAGKVRFVRIDLEDMIEALRKAGASEHADALYTRYCDFDPVHDLVRAACLPARRRARPTRTRARRRQPPRPTPAAAKRVAGR